MQIRFILAQINPIVGDIQGNTEKIRSVILKAQKIDANVIVFPEMCLTGYPPEDLLYKPAFIRDQKKALNILSKSLNNMAAVIGFVDEKDGVLFNAAAWVTGKKVSAIYHKQCLPNYGVFDEKRYFKAGKKNLIVKVKGVKLALTICEDIWTFGPHIKDLKSKKPAAIINISASPYHKGKVNERKVIFKKTVISCDTALMYCNLVGGQDELVFEGGSFCLNAKGKATVQLPQFESGLHIIDLVKQKGNWTFVSDEPYLSPLSTIEETFTALKTGLHDYVFKNGFNRVVLGLSGGIDSALVASLAVEALGKEMVVGVTMPTNFNLKETQGDAAELAKNLGIEFHQIPIQPLFEIFKATLAPLFQSKTPGLAEENLQARIRGTIIMALSNKFGWLPLTTGNKSEISTGYCTLYGDTAGGFAVIKDVLKTTVYDLCTFINKNAGFALIPETTIKRPPTAELRFNQKDEDSLGAYKHLDPLIVGYVEQNKTLAQLKKQSKSSSAYIRKIISLIDRSEYKRRQTPPGIKISSRSFGRDHRMPITNRYVPK